MHVRCSYCQGRRTLRKPMAEYLRLPHCRTPGCEARRKRLGKPRRFYVDHHRQRYEVGAGAPKPCYPGRGGCDGWPFPHRRGCQGCHHHPDFMSGPDPDAAASQPFIELRESLMHLKNAVFFMYPLTLDLAAINDLLPQQLLKPVGPLEYASHGFVSPFGRQDTEDLSVRAGDHLLLSIGSEEKMLPGSVISDKLAKKIAEIEEKEGRRIGGKARKRLKDDLIHELLPQAFVKYSVTNVILDMRRGLVIVDTSSRKAAEGAASEIRQLFGSFPAMPLNAEVAPRSILTGWIAGEPLPEGLSLGEECELRDPIEGGAVVRCQHQELVGEEIHKHLEAGKQVARLALVFGDTMSCVIDENISMRKIKLLDGAMDKIEESEVDGMRAETLATLALIGGEIGAAFDVLRVAFKLSELK